MIKHSDFSKRLLKWFDQHGRQHLPWQIDKSPYRVWVSEIMLQQTQVATVIPYFLRFMQRFPDVETLAQAADDEVMHFWAGLGYYSRARCLHRAAKMIVTEFNGQFPNQLDEVIKLPGVGQSTAGAILSIAFAKPIAILDGNVKRVLTRYHAISTPIDDKKTLEILWDWAQKYTPKKRVADYTQAIMDLGATLCTRSKPKCSICPFKASCQAFKHDLVDTLPLKNKTNKIPVRSTTMLVFKRGKEIFLQKRPQKGIWGGLWSLPEMPGMTDESALVDICHEKYAYSLNEYISLTPFRHTFTHYHLDIYPILIPLKRKSASFKTDAQQLWYDPTRPKKIGLPAPILSLLKQC